MVKYELEYDKIMKMKAKSQGPVVFWHGYYEVPNNYMF